MNLNELTGAGRSTTDYWVRDSLSAMIFAGVFDRCPRLKVGSCGHRQAPLSKGTLEGHVIECPLHFARFDVRTGKLLTGPTAAEIPTYQVRVEGDTVYVKR